MTHLNKHPVLWDIYRACQLIEACGASEALTKAVAAVSDLLPKVEALVDELAQRKADHTSTIELPEAVVEDIVQRAALAVTEHGDID